MTRSSWDGVCTAHTILIRVLVHVKRCPSLRNDINSARLERGEGRAKANISKERTRGQLSSSQPLSHTAAALSTLFLSLGALRSGHLLINVVMQIKFNGDHKWRKPYQRHKQFHFIGDSFGSRGSGHTDQPQKLKKIESFFLGAYDELCLGKRDRTHTATGLLANGITSRGRATSLQWHRRTSNVLF